jgi:phosphoribosylglycinamide formyltransferase 1
MPDFKIAAYISGSGSNLRKIIENSLKGEISSKVRLVIADNDAAGLEYPKSLGIETAVVSRASIARAEFLETQLGLLKKNKIDLIILAGYLKKLAPEIVKLFPGRILNIHPALLPKFGGKGMHGMAVHKAVIEAGEEFSGPTVHFVDRFYDSGEILLQKKVKVDAGDTPEMLQKKVLEVEHKIFTEAIKLLEEEE